MSNPDTYDLMPEDTPTPSGLPGAVRVADELLDTFDACGADLFAQAIHSLRTQSEFHLVTAATPTVARLVRSLLIDPDRRVLPWPLLRVWIDSSLHPDGEAQRAEISELLIDHAGVPAKSIAPALSTPSRIDFAIASIESGVDLATLGQSLFSWLTLDSASPGDTPPRPALPGFCAVLAPDAAARSILKSLKSAESLPSLSGVLKWSSDSRPPNPLKWYVNLGPGLADESAAR